MQITISVDNRKLKKILCAAERRYYDHHIANPATYSVKRLHADLRDIEELRKKINSVGNHIKAKKGMNV